MKLNKKIKKLHEQAERTIYNDYKSGYKPLLEKGHSFATHKQNLQYLEVEAFKV